MAGLDQLLDLFLHVDRHLHELATTYGGWTYVLLFLVVFCETGLVVTPFLPGDSLLFAVGALAATGVIDLPLAMVLLFAAAVLGDTVNYWAGSVAGPRLAGGGRLRLVRPSHLERTELFFARHGGKTVVLARFVPIVRTFAPFVAGAGAMSYRRFMGYNVVGGFAWVASCSLAGYAFGHLPLVRDHFSLVALGIVAVSLLPILVELIRARRSARLSARRRFDGSPPAAAAPPAVLPRAPSA